MWIAELVTDVISRRSTPPPARSTLPPVARRLLRLVVPSPDRSRVLARPNGLAGWTLPVIAVPDDDDVTWTDELVSAAGRAVGAAVQPVCVVGTGAWELRALGRVPSTGVTWIAREEAGRLGAHAAVLIRWADGEG
jgi:hypothetical protein